MVDNIAHIHWGLMNQALQKEEQSMSKEQNSIEAQSGETIKMQQGEKQQTEETAAFVTGQEDPTLVATWCSEEQLLYRTITLLKQGNPPQSVAAILKLTLTAVHKIQYQLITTGKVQLPHQPKPPLSHSLINSSSQDNSANSNEEPVLTLIRSSNPRAGSRLPNQTAQRIRRILFRVVKEGLLGSYQEMQELLLSEGIERSLSSIYRYIAAIKLNYKEYQDRAYAMYKKDRLDQARQNE